MSEAWKRKKKIKEIAGSATLVEKKDKVRELYYKKQEEMGGKKKQKQRRNKKMQDE